MTSETDILQRTLPRRAAAIFAILFALVALPAAASADPYFGTWAPGEPYDATATRADALERATGRRVDIVNWYQNWGGTEWIASVQPHVIHAVTDAGRMPLLTWEPRDPQLPAEQPRYALARIADGTHDAYITSFARSLRDVGSVVYLRPMHEMNGTWYPWGSGVSANTPAQFIAAWRRMHDIFAAEGASNVRWVWSPNNFDASSAHPLEQFYPGTGYVDVLATSGYNWGSARPQFGGWMSFNEVFRPVYDRLKALGPQPIWFAEIASAPGGGDKAAWVRDMFGRARGMERLQAIVWFNELKELDWRADADPAVAAAFAPALAGADYPLVVDSYDLAAQAAAAAEQASAAQSAAAAAAAAAAADAGAGAAAPPGAPPTSAGSSLAPHRPSDTAAPRGLAASAFAAEREAHAAAAALAFGSSSSANPLQLFVDARVSAARPTVLRWRLDNAAGVQRWTVFLDGRQVLAVAARRGATHRLSLRVSRRGLHRWRVEGYDAAGRRLVSAVRIYRVVRAR